MTDRTAALQAEIRAHQELSATMHRDAVVGAQVDELTSVLEQRQAELADLRARVEALEALPPEERIDYPALADQVAAHMRARGLAR